MCVCSRRGGVGLGQRHWQVRQNSVCGALLYAPSTTTPSTGASARRSRGWSRVGSPTHRCSEKLRVPDARPQGAFAGFETQEERCSDGQSGTGVECKNPRVPARPASCSRLLAGPVCRQAARRACRCGPSQQMPVSLHRTLITGDLGVIARGERSIVQTTGCTTTMWACHR